MGCLKLEILDEQRGLEVNPKFFLRVVGKKDAVLKKCLSSSTYGFNGKEKDDEIKDVGNSYDFGARIYDSRLGRWLSLDPLASQFPWQSPYVAFDNNPINKIDPTGGAAENAQQKPPGSRPKVKLTNVKAVMIKARTEAMVLNAFTEQFNQASGTNYSPDIIKQTVNINVYYKSATVTSFNESGQLVDEETLIPTTAIISPKANASDGNSLVKNVIGFAKDEVKGQVKGEVQDYAVDKIGEKVPSLVQPLKVALKVMSVVGAVLSPTPTGMGATPQTQKQRDAGFASFLRGGLIKNYFSKRGGYVKGTFQSSDTGLQRQSETFKK